MGRVKQIPVLLQSQTQFNQPLLGKCGPALTGKCFRCGSRNYRKIPAIIVNDWHRFETTGMSLSITNYSGQCHAFVLLSKCAGDTAIGCRRQAGHPGCSRLG